MHKHEHEQPETSPMVARRGLAALSVSTTYSSPKAAERLASKARRSVDGQRGSIASRVAVCVGVAGQEGDKQQQPRPLERRASRVRIVTFADEIADSKPRSRDDTGGLCDLGGSAGPAEQSVSAPTLRGGGSPEAAIVVSPTASMHVRLLLPPPASCCTSDDGPNRPLELALHSSRNTGTETDTKLSDATPVVASRPPPTATRAAAAGEARGSPPSKQPASCQWAGGGRKEDPFLASPRLADRKNNRHRWPLCGRRVSPVISLSETHLLPRVPSKALTLLLGSSKTAADAAATEGECLYFCAPAASTRSHSRYAAAWQSVAAVGLATGRAIADNSTCAPLRHITQAYVSASSRKLLPLPPPRTHTCACACDSSLARTKSSDTP